MAVNSYNLFIQLSNANTISSVSKKTLFQLCSLIPLYSKINFYWLSESFPSLLQISFYQFLELRALNNKNVLITNTVLSAKEESKNIIDKYAKHSFRVYCIESERKIKESIIRNLSNPCDNKYCNLLKNQFALDFVFQYYKVKKPSLCYWSSCLGKTIYILNNGDLDICPFNPGIVKLNKPMNCKTFEDVFDTESFEILLSNEVQKRAICLDEKCKYYPAYQGGCAFLAYGEKIEQCKIKQAINSAINKKGFKKEDAYSLISLIKLWRNNG